MTNRVLETISVAGIAVLLLVSGCKISEQGSGENKKVTIDAPGASVKIDSTRTTNDTGLALYPGAAEKHSGDEDNHAHVSLDMPFLKAKVVSLQYTSSDSPEKILAFYRNKMAGFGTVLECKDDAGDVNILAGHNLRSPVSCGKRAGKSGEASLKVGTEGDQHVVTVKPSGSGSEFSLVYVHLATSKSDDDYSGKQPS